MTKRSALARLTAFKEIDGFTLALTNDNSLVVVAENGTRGFPELSSRGFRKPDDSPIRFLGALRKVPSTVETACVQFLEKQALVREKIAEEYGPEEENEI